MATVMLLVIGIVGTTVAPWQLFFQQSYVIDKRITPRFMKYEKADLWIGIAIVVRRRRRADGRHRRRVRGHARRPGNFTDSAGLAHGVAAYAGHFAGAVFAVALLDAAVIGAFAVSLSSRLRDRRRARHEALAAPRRRPGQGLLRAVRGADLRRRRRSCCIPGSPLGLITEGVQVLAGVLLPSAPRCSCCCCATTRRCSAPGSTPPKTNAFTSAVIAVLITLSVVLTASVMFPAITAAQIVAIVAGCAAVAVRPSAGCALGLQGIRRRGPPDLRTPTTLTGSAERRPR